MRLRPAIITTLALTSLLQADPDNGSISIEIDPATYALDGYSFHLKKRFASLPRWQFGIGLYAMDFPDLFVDIHPENRDKGWEQRLDQGVGLFVDYFFSENAKGWFTGFQLAHQEYEITRGGDSEKYGTLLAMAHLGYQYQFYEGWYLRPWAGMGYSEKISGSNRVGDEVYEVPSIVGLITLHIGYKF